MAFQAGKCPQSVRFLVYYSTKENCREVNVETTEYSQFDREIGWPRLYDSIVAISRLLERKFNVMCGSVEAERGF